MRNTGAFIAELLAELHAQAQVGTNLLDLEHRARQLIKDRGAISCYWDYAPSFGRGPFRNVICLSVNDAVLHGLPHDYFLRDGDLLSMDIAVTIDGWSADSARSLIVGTPRPEDQRIIEATERALAAGIAAARPGGRLGDISAAIGARVRLPGEHPIRWSRNRPHHARGSTRSQHRARRSRTQAQAWVDSGARALVRPRYRQDRLRPGRVDHPVSRRVAYRSQRTHRGRHRRGTVGAHGATSRPDSTGA